MLKQVRQLEVALRLAVGENMELIQATRRVNAGGSETSELTQTSVLHLRDADNDGYREGTNHARARRSYIHDRLACYIETTDWKRF